MKSFFEKGLLLLFFFLVLQHTEGIANTFGSKATYDLTVFASGTGYSLTTTDALLDFGTTDPSLVLDKQGTYLLMGRVNLRYNAATFAANQTATIHLRRTNNTPANITNATTTATLRIVTTITETIGIVMLPFVIYATENSNDNISIFGYFSVAPVAGSVDVTEASIAAIRLY